jgi:ribose 5-phosphate isomerase B
MSDVIYIASDHAGFALKNSLVNEMDQFHWIDLGCDSEESVDYPDFADKVASRVHGGDRGVLICGSGQGMVMRANKYPGVRAALCWNSEITTLARQHNDANLLCLGSRFTEIQDAKQMVHLFLNTPFVEGRHSKRVEKIGAPWKA